MRNFKSVVFAVTAVIFSISRVTNCFGQLSYTPNTVDRYYSTEEYVSDIAYKLPFRGENYKFYGTLSYHIYGRAFASCNVHNTIVEAFHLCENSTEDAKFKILKSSGKKNGRILPFHNKKNGHYAVFMTPLLHNDQPVKYYYRTGLFRFFRNYDKNGILKANHQISIDFENTALLIFQLDNAAEMNGLRIKKIIFNRSLTNKLFSTTNGEYLLSKDIYFAKYLSEKINNRYDDLFYVEFERIRK